MKKTKLLAVLSAAMLGCCAMGGTAFAEEAEPVDYSKYQLGDITMDGVVDVEDAQLVLDCYTRFLLRCDMVSRGWITEGQLALGNVDGREESASGIISPVTVEDALIILQYYSHTMTGKYSGMTIEEYVALT